jgi:phosphoglycolate phosphatase
MLYLFDIDGTILLTGGAGSRALNAVFAERYGVEGAMDAINAGGKTDPIIIGEIFASKLGRAPTEAEIDEILAAYIPRLRVELPRSQRFRTMPAVHDALAFLDQQPGIQLALATGNVKEGARAKLEHIDLWHRFTCGGFGCDSAERARLVAVAIERACAVAGAPYDCAQVIVVGDTPHDVAAARACGVKVVAVATGSYTRDQLAEHTPDALLDTLEELPRWHGTRAR